MGDDVHAGGFDVRWLDAPGDPVRLTDRPKKVLLRGPYLLNFLE